MKIYIVLCCAIVASLATPTTLELHSQWNNFKLTHSKQYDDSAEEQKRFGIFQENVKKIAAHNKLYEQGLASYKMAVNQFADWTHEEFVNYLKLSKKPEHNKPVLKFTHPLKSELPTAVDWRQKNGVTPVKNQGKCGSCWAFSTTGGLESHYAIKYNKFISLSEQELIDCSRNYTNDGCNGGLALDAYAYVTDHGLTTEEAYQYEGVDGTCRRSGKQSAVKISGYVQIEYLNEVQLQNAVALIGPTSVSVDATNWSPYSEGIFDGVCGSSEDDLNHAVLAVGYGTDQNGKDYWIIKNSWGVNWGENGYIRVLRGQNACGLAVRPAYPLLE